MGPDLRRVRQPADHILRHGLDHPPQLSTLPVGCFDISYSVLSRCGMAFIPLHVMAHPLDQGMGGIIGRPLAAKVLEGGAHREHRVGELV